MKLGQYLDDAAYDYALKNDLFTNDKIMDYLKRVSPVYIKSSNPRQFLQQYSLFHQVKGTDGTAVEIVSVRSESTAMGETQAWINIAAANVLPDELLKLASMILTARNLDINRAHLDIVRDAETAIPGIPQSGYITMLRLLVNPDPESHSTDYLSQTDFKAQLQLDLKRLKWLDDQVLQLGLIKYPSLGLHKAEIITAFCGMLHGPLSKVDAQAYASASSMLSILDSSPHFIQLADSIASLFLQRFKPDGTSIPCHSALSEENFQKSCTDLTTKISRLHHEAARNLLLKMLDTVKGTLRTNFYCENRYALSLRLHPSIMVGPTAPAMPFGVFFSHGRHFNGFHCRFRDIARGGLRLVTPASPDQYVLESSRQFDEAYGLSFAQQLKNKDIPEVNTFYNWLFITFICLIIACCR